MSNEENVTTKQLSISDLPQSDFSYEGYEVVRGEFFAHLFEPSVTFNNEKVSVNTACINKLPNIDYVQFLVNPKEKKLAVKPCMEEMKDSFVWASKGEDGKRKPKTVSCRIFFAKVMNLMNWNPDYRYKILGKLIRTQSDLLFVFDLTSAETFLKKTSNENADSRKARYPESWRNQFGVPVKEHRDMTLVSIFDDYTVFKIDKDEERKGMNIPDESNDSEFDEGIDNTGHEEVQAEAAQNNPENYE